jgi:hypothetical protein
MPPGQVSEGMEVNVELRHQHTHVYSSPIHSAQNIEPDYMLTN